MSKRGLIFALVMVSLVGCKKGVPTQESVAPQNVTPQSVPQQSVATPAQPQAQVQMPQSSITKPATVAVAEPQFGWNKYDEENFVIEPLQGRFFVVPRNSSRLRVEINADSPVFAGVVNKADIANKGVVNASNFSTLPCAFVKNAHGMQDCSLDPHVSDVFVLRDVREKPALPATQSAENKVKISLSAWACVANCKPLTGDAK
jgi:hypothetical protein